MRSFILFSLAPTLLLVAAIPHSLAQSPEERVDRDAIKKIKEEGLERSQVMDTISFLTDVHGPRLTGSPQTRAAAEWTKGRLAEWGLANAHLESWGPFGRGWSLDGFTANMIQPTFAPLIAYPKAWSGSTPKAIRGSPIYLDAANEKELDQFRGKLHRAIVLLSPPRELKALFEPLAQRQTDTRLLALANGDFSALRGQRGLPPGTVPAAPAPCDEFARLAWNLARANSSAWFVRRPRWSARADEHLQFDPRAAGRFRHAEPQMAAIDGGRGRCGARAGPRRRRQHSGQRRHVAARTSRRRRHTQ